MRAFLPINNVEGSLDGISQFIYYFFPLSVALLRTSSRLDGK